MALVTLMATAKADREYSFDKNQSFDANAITTIDVDMSSGDIKVERTSGNEIKVEYKNVIVAGDKDEAETINGKCDYDGRLNGDVLDIRVERPRRGKNRDFLDRLFSGNWDDGIHMYLRIIVPDGKSMTIRASSADVEAEGVKINLDIRGSSSDIALKNVEGELICDLSSGDVDVFGHTGNIRINGKSSDVHIDALKGDLDIRTSSGDGKIDGVKGSVIMEASSGDSRIYNIDGDLDVHTSSGDIYADGVSGSLRAESSSGDIRLSALSAAEGDFDIESVSGDVTMEISPEFSGRLSLRSSSGDINSRLAADIQSLSDSRLAGNIGNGKGRLNVNTSSGDIRISEY